MFNFKLRDTLRLIGEEAGDILQNSALSLLLDEVPAMVIVLNRNRQIIYSNRKFSEVIENGKTLEGIGSRPGECMLCVHAQSAVFGCGSSEFCRVCGLSQAISLSERGCKSSGECHIALNHGAIHSFNVTSQPFDHDGKNYVVVFLQDISDSKTREMLEKIFLHDINNSVSALNGLNELLDELPMSETKSIINDLAVRLTDEIHSYRLITEAENHSLSVQVSYVEIDDIIAGVIKLLKNSRYFRNRNIQHVKSGYTLHTDYALLRRVLLNLVKNAFEASGDDQQVTVSTEKNEKTGNIDIYVKSFPLMDKDVQLQLFQRSFSTKGSGRGWGTYSIRLLTEGYLGGKVTFASNEEQRTVFMINLPSLPDGFAINK